MDNTINLNFNDNTLTGLVGFPFGEKIYQEQVKNFFDINSKNNIIFPDQIERIAISFIQGFTKELFEKYGRDKTIEKIEISGKKRVVDKFYAVI